MSGSIVTAGPEHAAELAAVAAVTFPLACPPSTTPEAIAEFVAQQLSEERFRRYLADDDRILLAAQDETGRIEGYAMLVRGEPYDAEVAAQLRIRPTIELSKFYVLPEHHGRGTAARLMRSTLFVAGSQRVAGVWLGTNQQNTRAQRFYEKHGFARIGTKRFLVGGRYEDDYVFERALAPRSPDWVVTDGVLTALGGTTTD